MKSYTVGGLSSPLLAVIASELLGDDAGALSEGQAATALQDAGFTIVEDEALTPLDTVEVE